MTSQQLLDFAVPLALEAGMTAHRYFRQPGLKVGLKPDQSLLSEADAAAEDIVSRWVSQACPDHPLIGEETISEHGPEHFARALGADHAWVVDPIDGTNNFVASEPLWCVSIAHLERGRPTLGVNYFPALNDELYFNEGDALFLRCNAASRSPKTKRLPPAAAAPQNNPLFMAFDSFFYRYRLTCPHIPRISGCTVWNVLSVTLGRAAAAATSAHLWDFAAPLAYAPGRGIQMASAATGQRIDRFTPEMFHMTPDVSKQAWKVKELYLIAPDSRMDEIRRSLQPQPPRPAGET